MKIRKGMKFKSKTNHVMIEILNRKNGNGHWNTRKITGSNKNVHMIHEGTLKKYYSLVGEK